MYLQTHPQTNRQSVYLLQYFKHSLRTTSGQSRIQEVTRNKLILVIIFDIFWWPLFSHYVYVLRNYALAPLPLVSRSSVFLNFQTTTHLLKNTEAERRSSALRLTLTTAYDHATQLSNSLFAGM